MPHLILDLILGFGIGLSLGLLGGGGSILTVPALVYVVGQSPQAAVTTSLAIVGANSMMGASFHSRRGTLNWRVALIFGGAGMLAAYLAAGLSRFFLPEALLVAFAMLMLLIGGLMFSGRMLGLTGAASAPRGWPVILAAGAGVGLLTGVLGVGGGFLIVPALVILVGLPMQQAIGTSLLVIAANSLAALLGHLNGETLDMSLMAVFAVAGWVGTSVGAHLAQRIPADRLRRGFAVFVVILAIFLLADNLPVLWH
ncbi:MAG: sulfite exporter TauE/SafE family protein [Anaerolineales bacterium]|nr:sulfite exporter TauE/SafE family protein [Anaerolineales bacterium]